MAGSGPRLSEASPHPTPAADALTGARETAAGGQPRTLGKGGRVSDRAPSAAGLCPEPPGMLAAPCHLWAPKREADVPLPPTRVQGDPAPLNCYFLGPEPIITTQQWRPLSPPAPGQGGKCSAPAPPPRAGPQRCHGDGAVARATASRGAPPSITGGGSGAQGGEVPAPPGLGRGSFVGLRDRLLSEDTVRLVVSGLESEPHSCPCVPASGLNGHWTPGVLATETSSQQERLQAIAEKRRRQAEIENKRRQLDEDRRQLQHLKSKALRERWLLEGTPSSASQGDEAMQKQMQQDEQKARQLEESVSRLEKEIELLENGDVVLISKANTAAPSPARAPALSPAKEEHKTEVVLNSQQTPAGTPKEKRPISNSPVRTVEGPTMMKAAMYSVAITVEKDKVTGETRVLSSTTSLPKELLPQGIKVYEDETKVVHAVDGTADNGIHPLSSSEVDELIHKADEVTLSEAGSTTGPVETRGAVEEAVRTTPSRREITGVQAQPGEATSGPPGAQPGQEPPVTMIFMGYQNVEDEAETKKVLGLQDTITAELVVIEDAADAKEAAPPNGSAAEPPVTTGSREENQAGPEPPASDPQDLDMKKQRCKCCSVM
ncbi:PREDICTED: paralemmin-1 [Chrysochloris asiatica]|uniref:Paralemmin-1 n=1 Tax=Chrysochloris asiatica TaxID=185453 RepID=A0A9B0X3C4_CHRAS|nr:PREDICTED: paralemmin-1 [Chrysochloris asiatica]